MPGRAARTVPLGRSAPRVTSVQQALRAQASPALPAHKVPSGRLARAARSARRARLVKV